MLPNALALKPKTNSPVISVPVVKMPATTSRIPFQASLIPIALLLTPTISITTAPAAKPINMEISEAKIYGVATFYENFSLDPKGKYVIKICDGTACHVRKSIPILEALRKQLSLTDKKKTTNDMMFTLETVSCLGACGLAPVITINDKVYPKMTPDHVVEIINNIKEEEAQNADK